MFSNFKAAFKDQPSYKTKTPKAVLDAISEELPAGFKYVSMSDGICGIETEDEFVLGTCNIDLPDTLKGILPVNPLMSDIWTYVYNAQKKIRLEPDKDGCYTINGELIKAEAFVKAPLTNIKIKGTHFFMIPPPFPAPFPIEIGTVGYNMKLLVQRQPHESIVAKKFSSIDNKAIKLTYVVDFESGKTYIKLSIKLERAKTIQDIVNANHIFSAFNIGKGLLEGAEIPVSDKNQLGNTYEDTMLFWDKILALQDYFGVEFIPSYKITRELANKVEEFDQCFIQKKPFKLFQNFEMLSGIGNIKHGSIQEMIGNEVYFEMVHFEEFMLFGVELKYYKLIGIFGAVVKLVNTNDKNLNDDFEITLEPRNDKLMYSSTLYFKDEGELELFRVGSEYINSLKNADELKLIT